MHTNTKKHKLDPQNRKQGFTLIELLTVIAIIGILAGIIIPVVGKVRNSTKATHNLSQLRNLATAAVTFASDNKGRVPGLGLNTQDRWPMQLFPYIGIPNGDRLKAYSYPVFHNTKTPFEDYQTPDGRGNANGCYGYNNELQPAVTGVLLLSIQNPSSTIIFGDKAWNWKNEQSSQASQNLRKESAYPSTLDGLAANWDGKFHCAYADSHVKILSEHPGPNAFRVIPAP
jgi:prepilin-type N-terminal cleavage/methylation domain-containing protein